MHFVISKSPGIVMFKKRSGLIFTPFLCIDSKPVEKLQLVTVQRSVFFFPMKPFFGVLFFYGCATVTK